MAVTALLVQATPNRLRYLLTQDGAAGTTVTITSSGAASPDLITDSVAGPIKNLATVVTNGFGPIAAGTAVTAAIAAALWESFGNAVPIVLGTIPGQKSAKLHLTVRTGAAPAWSVTSGAAGGLATITATAQAGAGSAWLDIFVDSAIG